MAKLNRKQLLAAMSKQLKLDLIASPDLDEESARLWLDICNGKYDQTIPPKNSPAGQSSVLTVP